MKYQNYEIYLPYYWELLGELAIEEYYSQAEIRMDSEAKASNIEYAKVTDTVAFPGQILLWEPVRLDSKRTPEPVTLWEMRGSGATLNQKFIKVWLAWKARQVSSSNLVPEDLRQLFEDPNKVLVTDDDFEDTNEGIDKLNEFKAVQRELFKEYLGWTPRC